jgi:hypothetical protein
MYFFQTSSVTLPLDDLIRHIATRPYPVPSAPQVLPPVPLLQTHKFTQKLVRTLTLQVLHRSRHRYMRRYPDQQMHMIPIHRPRIDRHLQAPRYIPQQFPRSKPHIPGQDRIPVLRDPYQMIFAVPHCVAATFIVLHASYGSSSVIRPAHRLKARDLRIPYGGL